MLARHDLFIGYFSIFKVFFCQDKRAIRMKQMIVHLKALISGFLLLKNKGFNVIHAPETFCNIETSSTHIIVSVMLKQYGLESMIFFR